MMRILRVQCTEDSNMEQPWVGRGVALYQLVTLTLLILLFLLLLFVCPSFLLFFLILLLQVTLLVIPLLLAIGCYQAVIR